MTKEFIDGATSRVLRMRGFNDDWVPVHMTVTRVELEPNVSPDWSRCDCPPMTNSPKLDFRRRPTPTGLDRSGPRGGSRRAPEEDRHLDGDDDVQIVYLASGVSDPHLAGHRGRTAQAAAIPDGSRAAAASAARSAADCARWLATSTEPRYAPAPGNAKQHRDHRGRHDGRRAAIIAAAPPPRPPWRQYPTRATVLNARPPWRQEVAVPVHLDQRASGRDPARGIDRRPFVTAGSEAGGLARGVDAAHLHRQRGDTGKTEHQHHDQRGDPQGRLNGARAGAPTATAG